MLLLSREVDYSHCVFIFFIYSFRACVLPKKSIRPVSSVWWREKTGHKAKKLCKHGTMTTKTLYWKAQCDMSVRSRGNSLNLIAFRFISFHRCFSTVKKPQSFNPIRSRRQPNIYLKCIYLTFLPWCVRNYIASNIHTNSGCAVTYTRLFLLFAEMFYPFACWLLLSLSVPYVLCPIYSVFPCSFFYSQSEFISHKDSVLTWHFIQIYARSLHALLLIFLLKTLIYLHMTHE